MWNKISYLKEIIIWSLPFYALHVYLENVYNFSLDELISWWFDNFNTTDSAGLIFISFILIFLLFSLPFTSLINSFYLGLLGEKQTLVYLGNPSSSRSSYYKLSDKNKETFTGYNVDKEYCFSFENINKITHFVKDPGTKNIVGQKNKRLHPIAIISTFFFMVFLLMPALGVIHAFSYPMYINLNGENAILHGEAMDAFEIVLLKFSITKEYSALILFGGLFLGLFFGGRIPNEDNNKTAVALPGDIKEGSSISATPVEINIHYEKRRNSDDSTTKYDSGYRHVIFCFDKGFNPPVFITLYFGSQEYPEYEEKIKSKILSKTEMGLMIDENLGVRLEYKLSLN